MTRDPCKLLFVAAALILSCLAVPKIGAAEVQTIPIAGNGWHFVALQVRPDDPNPAKVFPGNTAGASIQYDSIWTYDPMDGWRVYVPASSAASDLSAIDPLRGYWIHVTGVPSGGASFQVLGTAVTILETGDSGWQAIGFPVAPGAKDLSIAEALPGLGSLVGDVIEAAWTYDRTKSDFSPISLTALCTPSGTSNCVQAGAGYWVRTKLPGLKAGQALTVKTRRIALTPGSPVARIDLEFEGVHLLGGTPVDLYFEPAGLQAPSSLSRSESLDADSLRFYDSKATSLDGKMAYEPGAERTLGGGGSCSKCPEGKRCATVCVTPERADPVLFVQLDKAAFLGLSKFQSSAAEINSFGSIVVTMGGKTVGRIPVQAEPVIVKGRYKGVLTYENGIQGIPLEMVLDQCRTSGTMGELQCSDRSLITAVINPVLQGRQFNGRDDDNNGLVDDSPDEETLIPSRQAPGFPPNTVLHGRLGEVDGQLRLTLAGLQNLNGEYPAASNQCDGAPPTSCDVKGLAFGRCSRTGKKCCSTTTDCQTEGPAGIWTVASSQSREIAIEAVVFGPTSIAGTLTERHFSGSDATQSASDVWSILGKFMLSRTDEPVCASIIPVDPTKDTGEYAPFHSLGIGCRSKDDCPKRCVKGEGNLMTESDWDPKTKKRSGWAGTCTDGCKEGRCEPYTCSFLEFGPALENARKFQSFKVKAKTGTVELIGGQRRTGTIADGAVTIADLPCGKYDVVIQAPACPTSGGTKGTRRIVVPVDTCSGAHELTTPEFDDCDVSVPQAIPVGMSGGGVSVIGNTTSSVFVDGTGFRVSGNLIGGTGAIPMWAVGGDVSGIANVRGGSVVESNRLIPRFTNVSESYVDGVSLRLGLLEVIYP